MSQTRLKEIAPYLANKRAFDEELFARISQFLAEKMGHSKVRARLGKFSNYGSCSVFEISTSNDESSSERPDFDGNYCRLEIAISARGPFVTSWGAQLQSTPEGQWRPPGEDTGMMQVTAVADAQAEIIGREIAKEFGLKYLDREGLRAILLDPGELGDDADLSLDHSDPTALNVLFTESL
jgi:hypothetical protein